jgi:hypothetical protein
VVRVGTVPQKPPGCAAALCSLHATLNTKCPEYVRNVNEVNVCVLARRCRCDVAVLLLTSVEMPLASSRKSLLWQAVEIQACGTKVICKYCQRAPFAASAARIREHLSGGSKDITGCIHVHAIPDDLKAELAKKQAQTACERDWSTRGHIHSLKRNNLDPDRASDMNYCYKTLRLRHKLNDVFAEDQFYEWDS